MVDIFIADERVPQKQPKVRKSKHETVADRLVGQQNYGRMRGFNVLPKRVRFETQEAKEKVILLLRQHWVTQIGWVALVVVMLFLPLLFRFVPIIDFLPPNYRIMAIIFWYLLVLAFVYEQFLSWFFDLWLITDERVIDIYFSNLLYKQVSEAKIDNIEDVTYNQGGVIKALFDYGNVSLQTAATEEHFQIRNVPHPNRVVQVLNDLKLEEEEEKLAGRVR